MAIVCLEGASGVGKSTVAARLSDLNGAAVVPEVNLLFKRPPDEPRFWYFERQADRWRMALEAAGSRQPAVLDGDPFQPLWYNWAYSYDLGEPAEQIHGFYARLLAEGKISFPDRYFLLSTGEEELRIRRERDAIRTRKNFERHLRFIRPQRAYFEFLASLDDGWVEFLENENAESAARRIAESISGLRPDDRDQFGLLKAVRDWLSRHTAEEFI